MWRDRRHGVGETSYYGAHQPSHGVRSLWRLHAIHHSAGPPTLIGQAIQPFRESELAPIPSPGSRGRRATMADQRRRR
jgi:hypothetical protein